MTMKTKKYKPGQIITFNKIRYRVVKSFTVYYLDNEKPLQRISYTCGKCNKIKQCNRFKSLTPIDT